MATIRKLYYNRKKPDASARNAANYWLSKENQLAPYYNKVYEDKFYKIIASRKINSALTAHSLPNVLPTDRGFEENNGKLLLHKHAFLNLTIDDTPITIPANIGIDPTLQMIIRSMPMDRSENLHSIPIHQLVLTYRI